MAFVNIKLGVAYKSFQEHLAVICRVIMENTLVQVAPLVTGEDAELLITDATGAQVTTARTEISTVYPLQQVPGEPEQVVTRDDFVAYLEAHMVAMGFNAMHYSAISLLVESVIDGSMQDVLFWG